MTLLQSRPGRVMLALAAVFALAAGLIVVQPVSAQDRSSPSWLDRNPIPADQSDQFEVNEVRPNGRVSVTQPFGRVYGSEGDGYALIVGDDMIGVCTGAPQVALDTVVYRADGSFVVRTEVGGAEVPMYLYETDLDVFGFFGEVCGAFAEGTPIPAPTAVGLGTFRVFERPTVVPWLWNGVQPVGQYRNSVEGTFADAQGNTFEVDAFAGFAVNEDLEPQFNRLELNVTPTAR